jgi:hypothetical protein
MRGAGIRPHGLHADADDRRFLRQPAGTFDGHARRMRAGLVGIEEPVLVARALVPSGAIEQPRPLR